MKLQGKVAVVTGSSRGIGKAIALGFAREGADVVVAARTEAPGGPLPGTIYETADAIKALGRKALAVKTDLTVDEDIEALAQQTLAEFGRVDILVGNAAAYYRAPFLDTSLRRWDLVMRVNLRATFLLMKAMLPAMIQQKSGHIINVSPAASLDLMPGGLVYGLAKMGTTLLSLGLAKEVQEHNIAVNSLWPGGTRATEGARVLRMLRDDAPWVSPETMADAAVIIASADPASFTGRSVTDEEVLREAGITDLSRYHVPH